MSSSFGAYSSFQGSGANMPNYQGQAGSAAVMPPNYGNSGPSAFPSNPNTSQGYYNYNSGNSSVPGRTGSQAADGSIYSTYNQDGGGYQEYSSQSSNVSRPVAGDTQSVNPSLSPPLAPLGVSTFGPVPHKPLTVGEESDQPHHHHKPAKGQDGPRTGACFGTLPNGTASFGGSNPHGVSSSSVSFDAAGATGFVTVAAAELAALRTDKLQAVKAQQDLSQLLQKAVMERSTAEVALSQARHRAEVAEAATRQAQLRAERSDAAVIAAHTQVVQLRAALAEEHRRSGYFANEAAATAVVASHARVCVGGHLRRFPATSNDENVTVLQQNQARLAHAVQVLQNELAARNLADSYNRTANPAATEQQRKADINARVIELASDVGKILGKSPSRSATGRPSVSKKRLSLSAKPASPVSVPATPAASQSPRPLSQFDEGDESDEL